MLLPRLLTAVIGIPIVVYLIYSGGMAFAGFVFFIIAFSLHEYASLMKLGQKPVNNFALYLFGLLLPAVMYFDYYSTCQAGGDNFAGAAISITVIGVICCELFMQKKYLERMGLTFLGIFMVSWCMFHLIPLRNLQPEGSAITFLLIITVWVMDTAAYFFGKNFGKNQLTAVSPKKTWEGAIAGFIFAIATSLLLAKIFGWIITPAKSVVIGILIGIFGQMSDIAESMLKRAVGSKDSSNLLPGHGGILDRFDSYILLAPIIYYFMVFTK